jgi:ribosomal protein S18 acetylase RimI-like enzyme
MATPIRLSPLEGERDIARVIALETASYPSDEAASPEGIRFRQQHAGAFFQVATLASDTSERQVVGFVNGTLVAGEELTDASMGDHDPLGSTLCIHSVVIDSAFRRHGIATTMLQAYVRLIIESHPQVTRIALLAKAYLVGFYVKCGFTATRLSPVVHGKDPWLELVLDVSHARRLAVVQVDAFSARIFDGNPAAVVVMPQAQYTKHGVAEWMQNVAKENNLSETAYVARRDEASDGGIVHYDLRWFTPGTFLEGDGG